MNLRMGRVVLFSATCLTATALAANVPKSSAVDTCVVCGCGNSAPVQPGANDSADEKILKAGPGVTPPRLLCSVEPALPAQARARHISGTCTVSLIVDAQGLPKHVRILHCSDPVFADPAVKAVEQYRFRPAIFQNKPVATKMDIVTNSPVE